MDEEFQSLIVTDPDLVDEGIDVSGLRTTTDTSPFLLGNIPDYPGIQYSTLAPTKYSDLIRLFGPGLPTIDTSQPTTPAPPSGGGGSGDGGQATNFDPVSTPIDTGGNTDFEQNLIDAGIGVQGAIGDPVVAPGEIPYTQDEFDEFNREPVTPVSPTTQPIDPTGMLPQTSTPYMVEGALGVDPREKIDFVTEEDLADNTSLLQRLGLPADFDLKQAAIEAGLNLVAGVPITLIGKALGAVLPDRDPRQNALDELYDVKDGTIQSGLMKDYNPVSGNPLDPTYGLQEAYQDRIDTIENTLKDKYNMSDAEIADVKAGSYTGDVDSDLLDRLNQLEEAKAKEKDILDLYSGDVDERDQMLEDISLQNKIDAGIQAADDDKGSDMLDTSTGVNPFADIDTGVGEFDTTPITSETETIGPYEQAQKEFDDRYETINTPGGTITIDKTTGMEADFDTTPITGGAVPPGEIGGPGYIEPPTPDNIIANTGDAFDYLDNIDISQDAPTAPTEQEQIEAEYRELQRIAEQREADQRFAEQAAIERERARIAEVTRQNEIRRQAEIDRLAAEARARAAQNQGGGNGGGQGDQSGGRSSSSGESQYGGFCFDPNTRVQMADGSDKKIKEIKLGDNTKGGEVTGVFQFKATDEIHNYKGVTVAGSHYVKEDGKFIMVQDSPLAVKIDKIPVVYSLDTTDRRIFINDIEFADYNGDGVAKNFLNNAGIDLTGFDKEVLRQVQQRLI